MQIEGVVASFNLREAEWIDSGSLDRLTPRVESCCGSSSRAPDVPGPD